jgi:hypothetical protein
MKRHFLCFCPGRPVFADRASIIVRAFGRDYSLDAAGADAGAGEAAAGAIATGAGALVARGGLGAAGFFAAAAAGDAWVVGRGEVTGTFAAGLAERGVDVVVAVGSGVMMLTGGVEAALGNSALVGLPVGTPGTSAAIGVAGAEAGGRPHVGA